MTRMGTAVLQGVGRCRGGKSVSILIERIVSLLDTMK